MSNPTEIQIHVENAKFVRNSGFDVVWNTSQSWVEIGSVDDSVFLQGHEADEYLSQAKALWERLEDIDYYTLMLSLAKPYIEK